MRLQDFKNIVASLTQKGREMVRSSVQPDLYSLLRLRREVTWIDHIGSPGQLLMALCVALLAVLVALGFVFGILEGLLKHVSLASFPALVLWLHDPIQFPLPLNVRFTPASLSSFQTALASAAAISFLYLSFAAGLLRDAWRDFRSVFLFSRKSSPPARPPSASQFMRISPAMGLSPTVIDAPSLTGVLDLLQDPAGQEPPLGAAIADDAQAQAEKAEESRTHIRVTLSHTLTITLCGADGKQETCSFKNETWAALVAYLAMQPKGRWIPKNTVLLTIYGGEQAEQYSLCKLHIRRIHRFLQDLAADAGLLPSEQHEVEGCPSLELIEHLPRDRSHPWRLAPACEVEVFPNLSSLCHQLQFEKRSQVHLLRWADFYRHCELAVEEYGKGLLTDHQPWHRTWRWSKGCFIEYRDMCLRVLNSALASGRERLGDEQLPPNEHAELLNQLATLSRWSALAAIGLVPEGRFGRGSAASKPQYLPATPGSDGCGRCLPGLCRDHCETGRCVEPAAADLGSLGTSHGPGTGGTSSPEVTKEAQTGRIKHREHVELQREEPYPFSSWRGASAGGSTAGGTG